MYCQSSFSFYLKFVSLPKADVPNKYSHFKGKIVKSILFYNEGRKASSQLHAFLPCFIDLFCSGRCDPCYLYEINFLEEMCIPLRVPYTLMFLGAQCILLLI
jgi:hypothetical protein